MSNHQSDHNAVKFSLTAIWKSRQQCLSRLVPWLLLAVLCSLPACTPAIVDSGLTDKQAIWTNQPPDAPKEIQQQLTLLDVHYYGFDQKLHQGQIVIHKALASNIQQLFAVIRDTHFPVESVLPIAHPLIQLKGPYGLSPDTNNTSAYVWRPIVGSRNVSLHGLGLAIDINPRLNPYCKGDLILPPGATYETAKPGTLTPNSRVVQAFKELGWEWGGDWAQKGKVDYMHFQKVPSQLEPWVEGYRN